jgi:PKD repeat protein
MNRVLGNTPLARVLLVSVVISSVSIGSQVLAFSGYGRLWERLYPESSSGAASCAMCHNGFRLSQYNAYGWDIRLGLDARLSITQAIVAAEDLDSDGEGSTNWEEIDANTQPGWTVGPNNTTFDSRGNMQPNQMAPGSVPGELDPVVSTVPPVAAPGGPYAATVGQAVQFDGSGSYDLDGTIEKYSWDFGDGSTGDGVSPTHTYANQGFYTVRLTVTDDDGLTSTASTLAMIEATVNQPPVADPGGPYTGSPNQTIQFDASASYDPDGSISQYWWDFGDGSFGAGITPTHSYDKAGEYLVSLTVVDDQFEMAMATTSVTIVDSGPPPAGEFWTVRVGVLDDEFQLSIRDVDGLLNIQESFPDGRVIPAIGLKNAGYIIWFDVLGSIFYGTVDGESGTMMGIVYDFMGIANNNTIWFAEQF